MLVGLLVWPPGAGVLAGPALASGGRGGVAHDVVVLGPGLHLHIVWIIIYILWISIVTFGESRVTCCSSAGLSHVL